MKDKGEIIIYQTENGEMILEVNIQDEMIYAGVNRRRKQFERIRLRY